MALREALSKPTLARTPEPTADMGDEENVRAFHAQGSEEGPLVAVYHFNATAIHALAPKGSTVLDLGCGSGQCLRYLAMRRPDLRLVGIDLSQEMVTVGNQMLAERGLSDRVVLRVGDMTSFAKELETPVHVITSIFSLHHLPSSAHLYACLAEISRLRARDGPALWIFDHARPRQHVTAEEFPWIFTPHAPRAFNTDSMNSLIASWSFDELRSALLRTVGSQVESSLSRLLRLYQAHWAVGRTTYDAGAEAWRDSDSLSRPARKDADRLSALFAKLPTARA